ncbi:MAG: hypothetical protein GQ527_11825 [Bacteroidales bacterium]|nr:hypothetical protein [Bacteroidales bacterium]
MIIKYFTLILLIGLNLNPLFAQDSSLTKKQPRIGLVLSGGGARGFAHIGVIKVLEEEGIDVDVIGGTSMGSIVGGLYAMGYSIDAIEEIALSQDWNKVLNDHIDRQDMGFYEKYDDEIHIFTLALKNRKVSIPPGLVYGQNVLNLLTKLTGPAFQSKDFKDLHKPFLCIATDLLSGDPIVLDTGNLAVAIRASMSVPSAFVPIKYGPYYLVDGGLINNLPAKEVRALGADILIGVDIQTPLYKQEEINNLIQVMSQSIFLNAENNFNENLKELDFLIKPEIDPFTSMDFDRADSLILRGEKKAREMIPQIRAFMDSIGLEAVDAQRKSNAFPEMDALYVDRVVIRGNEKVSDKFLLASLDIKVGDQVLVAELNKKITDLYGTKLFHTINYSLKYSEQGQTTLILDVEESSLFEINVGVHYNDYAKAGLLLNLTGRNVGIPNGRFSFDLAVGRVNRITATYVVDNGLKPGFGVDLNYFNQSGFVYDEYGKKLLSFNMAVMQHHGFGLLTFKNMARFRLGYELETNKISQGISILDFEKMENISATIFSDLVIDKLDRHYLPKKGYYFFSRFASGAGENTEIDTDENGNIIYPVDDFTYYVVDLYAAWAIPISKRFVVKPEFYYLKNFGTNIPLTKTATFGGFSQTYIFNYRPFPGYDFMELNGHTALYPELSVSYNLFDEHYLSLTGRFLSLNLVLDKGIAENDFYYGWQAKYTYYSLLGPISLSVAEAYPKKKLIFDFSLGFLF